MERHEGQHDAAPGQRGIHPIGVVSRRTGLTLHVLRAWERRYGVVQPQRTAAGQRLYSDADVERLGLLRRVTQAGRPISQVAALPTAELERLVRSDVQATAAPERAVPHRRFVKLALEAGERLDVEGVYGALLRGAVALRPPEFVEQVLVPLLHEVGDCWQAGRLGPSQEHAVSVAARRMLGWVMDAYDGAAAGPVLVATTVAGEQHEFGAMMVGVMALEAGWRVTYLGPSLPAEEIVRAARVLGARAVAVSIVNQAGGGVDVVEEMRRLRRQLGPGVAVLAGGAGAALQRSELVPAGVMVMTDLERLRQELRMQRGS